MKKVSLKRLFFTLPFLVILSGCGTPEGDGGRYFDHDGPPSDFNTGPIPLNSQDVELRVEKPVRAANRPYTVMGQSFRPMTGDAPFTQVGVASWYGKQFHGRKTAIGERYDMFAMTAAHPTMELPSFAKVTNLRNGRSVIVRVNDRGPFIGGRAIDMSYAAAVKLGYAKAGTTKVRIERITRKEIAQGYQEKLLAAEVIQTPTESTAIARSDTSPVVAPEPQPAPLIRETTPSASVEPVVASEEISTQGDDPLSTVLSAAEAVSAVPDFAPAPNVAAADIPSEEIVVTQVPEATATPVNDTATQIEDKPVPVTTPAWSAQIGAYRSQLNAKEAAAHAEMMLSEQNLPLPVRVVEDNAIYRVLVGNCDSSQDARRMLPKIFDTLGVKPFLIKK